jgi:hypothetical protein
MILVYIVVGAVFIGCIAAMSYSVGFRYAMDREHDHYDHKIRNAEAQFFQENRKLKSEIDRLQLILNNRYDPYTDTIRDPYTETKDNKKLYKETKTEENKTDSNIRRKFKDIEL